MTRLRTFASPSLAAVLFTACASTPVPGPAPVTAPTPAASPDAGAPTAAAPRVQPPAPGPARDVRLPEVRQARLANGLQVNHVVYNTLPVLHLRLMVRAGQSHDPATLPGLAAFTGDMLKEGARGRTSAQIAEAIEFVGGSIEVSTSADATILSVAVLKDHAQTALTLLADILTTPTFPQVEINKLKRRERDRLERLANDPAWLSRRAQYQALYGPNHPYRNNDITAASLERITRNDIVNFHRGRYVGGNMTLVVVGDLSAAELDPMVQRTLGRVRAGTAPALQFPEVPQPTGRQVILVDRPDSAQSSVSITNLALRRRDDDWIAFNVANQALGGGVSSRLFMDLRELRSLSYGVYARATEAVDVGRWFAGGSVRTAVTADAIYALMRHVECATTEAPPAEEIAQTRSYLVDSFPLSIETPGNVADLVTSLRLYDLPADYYDTYRTRVGAVDAAAALGAAQRHVHLDRATVVVVGTADAPVDVGPNCAASAALPASATFAQQISACATRSEGAPARETRPLAEALRAFGPVRVLNLQGAVVRELAAAPDAFSPPIRAACSELTAPALQQVARASQESAR
ncbi:MAG: insulinase family protein [Myxococcales bacterium]|nr:insulinase family protein [Myxococcales bacterium]